MFKNEKLYKVGIKGSSPLILHNCESADPSSYWAREMAPLKAKRKKTDSDYEEINRMQFLSSLYWSDKMGVYMPVENIQKMILESGRGLDQRGAKKLSVGVRFHEFHGFPLKVKNSKDKKALQLDPLLRYFRIVSIQKAKVGSTRAIFGEWSIEFEISIDDSIINPSAVRDWIEYGGDRIGLGSRRPYGPTPGAYGRFEIEKFEEVK